MLRVSKSVVGEREKAAVLEVLGRGYLGMGTEVQKFEQELAAYLDLKQAERSVACVNTGTAAVHLAVQAAGVGPGDEVLIPTLTFVATFQAVAATGAIPVPCDVTDSMGLLNLEDAELRLTRRTKALVAVHYASEPGDLDAVYQFAKYHGLCVIEDAAHAFGCTHRGRKIGSFGGIVCFSFDGSKNITSGEGGAVTSGNPEVMARVRDARLLGVQKDTEKRFSGQRSWEFDVTEQGYRYHMSDIMAAIGRVQLTRFESEFRPKREALAAQYRKLLADVPGVATFAVSSGVRVPHILPVRILDGKRDQVRAALQEAGIETGIHYKPSHLLSKFGTARVRLPVAERLYGEILTLPLHPEVTESDVEQVVEKVRKTLS